MAGGTCNVSGTRCGTVRATGRLLRTRRGRSRTGECVEVADNLNGAVPIRDSKNPGGAVLLVSARAWAPFLSSPRATPRSAR
ncbi:DUF397 domain-containing protein [Streptomyces gossypiisoli]|uniref:DUF397 domain-containing protein n=1 Tax=Streptomyces TaxID=1883 RepID=UPI002F96B2EC